MRTIVIILAILGINVLFTQCTKYEEVPVCHLSGMIVYSGSEHNYTGSLYTMYIDLDSDPDNGNHIKSFSGIMTEGELHYSYDIKDVDHGMYYVYIKFDSDIIDITKGTSHILFFGKDLMPSESPAAPNVQIKCPTVLDWEISK